MSNSIPSNKKCINCGSREKLADSHIVSNFIRKALTGIDTEKGKKYVFQWLDRKDLPKQNLPKPKLLCEKCDNKFGQTIERTASKLLIPKGDLNTFKTWHQPPYIIREISFSTPNNIYKVGEYQIDEDVDDLAFRRFSVLTAWRALHAINAEGNEAVANFLNSDDGRLLEKETINFLNNENKLYLTYPYLASLYYLGPQFASAISGRNDEIPFAWAYLQSENQNCVSIIMGFWLIIWPLLPDRHNKRDMRELQRMTFLDWQHQVAGQLQS